MCNPETVVALYDSINYVFISNETNLPTYVLLYIYNFSFLIIFYSTPRKENKKGILWLCPIGCY